MLEICAETLSDCLKLFPFLFLTYLFLEYLEHTATDKTADMLRNSGRFGALVGSLSGVVPQCGFSVIAANFYAVRLISLGTLTAVFLSTSDEMLPLMISGTVAPIIIIKILAYKIVCACSFGYITDYLNRRFFAEYIENPDIEAICRDENCRCEKNEGIFFPALYHTVKITLFIFLVTLVLNTGVAAITVKYDVFGLLRIPLVGEIIGAFLGLIPNCSPSVVLTQLYMDNYIGTGPLMSGSLVSGGAGLLVLFRINKHLKQNIVITLMLYAYGVLGGLICNLLPF